MRIAVSLIGPSPIIIDGAWSSWLPSRTPQLHSSDTDDPYHNLWYVETQDKLSNLQGEWSGNHVADNRALRQVALANRTLWGRFDWLALGGLDTCFDLPGLERELGRFDPNRRLFFGVPLNVDWCLRLERNGTRCCNASGTAPQWSPPGKWFKEKATSGCCSESLALGGQECQVWKGRGDTGFFRLFNKSHRAVEVEEAARTLARPPTWYFGGHGALLSRGLLGSMGAADVLDCYKRMRRGGGDVRVSSCIFSLTGVALTMLGGLLHDGLSQHKSCLSARANASLIKNIKRVDRPHARQASSGANGTHAAHGGARQASGGANGTLAAHGGRPARRPPWQGDHHGNVVAFRNLLDHP